MNRLFNKTSTNEITKSIMDYLLSLNIKFKYTMDLHETSHEDIRNSGFKGLLNSQLDISDGAFIYQSKTNDNSMAQSIISNFKENNIKVSSLTELWEEPMVNSIITYPEGKISPFYSATDTMEDFCFEHLTENAFTMETMAYESLKARIRAHKIAIETIIY